MPIHVCEDATEAWEHWYSLLLKQYKEGMRQPSRGGNVVGELLNAVSVIRNPTRGIVDTPKRNMSMRYATGELAWYLSGSNKVEDIAQYAKFWRELTDDGKTVNSAYGHRIFHKFGFDQWEYVKKLLRDDPWSRQAIIHIKEPSDQPTKDLPCTIALQYFIREGKLHATTIMRSNDIWLGFPYDVFSFTQLQVMMAMELDLDVGDYTHIAGSLHLYEKNVSPRSGEEREPTEDTNKTA